MCVCVCTVYTASINADISVYTTAALVAIKKYRKKEEKRTGNTHKQMSGAARIAHGHVHKLRVLMMVYKKKQIIRQTESTAMRPHRDDDAQRLFNEIKLRTLCVCVFAYKDPHTTCSRSFTHYIHIPIYIHIYRGIYVCICRACAEFFFRFFIFMYFSLLRTLYTKLTSGFTANIHTHTHTDTHTHYYFAHGNSRRKKT